MSDKKDRYLCCGCSLFCNDVELNIENNQIKDTFNCCGRAHTIFQGLNSENRIKNVIINKDGKPIESDYATGFEYAKAILEEAKNPLIYGFSNCDCESVLQGTILAKKLNGIIDIENSTELGILNMELAKNGIRLKRLEKLKDSFDLIVFWGSNVSDLHLRLASKYAVFPRSGIAQSGKESRTVVCVDIRPTPTEKIADISYHIEPKKDIELIDAMIKLNSNKKPENDKIAGLTLREVRDFLEMFKDSQNKVIFVGPGLTAGDQGFETLKRMAKLANELNAVVMMTTNNSNNFGCNFMLKTLVGFPFSVSFQDTKPSFNYKENNIAKLILDNKIDAAVIVNSDPISKLPFKLGKKLSKIPLIVIDHHFNMTTEFAKVVFPMTVPGIESNSTFVRMDGKIIKIDKIIEPLDDIKDCPQIIETLWRSIS
ncbi:MAG: formylmethanofuran dehydrogenase subunit B [Candidatus Helarchaeota archaeon]